MTVDPGTSALLSGEAPIIYAGFWRRFVSALIDALAMTFPVVLGIMIGVVVVRLVSASKGYDPTAAILVVLLVVPAVVSLFYFVLMESSPWQATVGKKALGLYVCDIEGHRLTLSRALGRTLAKYLSSLTVGIGYVMCGFTKKRQALHDIIARCLVLRRPRDSETIRT
jgi:uncharacterized RDD family membrane protein YckC